MSRQERPIEVSQSEAECLAPPRGIAAPDFQLIEKLARATLAQWQ
jgi:hypothetical protein